MGFFRYRPKALLLSGCHGPSMRYRVEHLAEELEMLGWETEIGQEEEPGTRDPERYDLLVLHRIPYTTELAQWVARFRVRGCPVLFDMDDLLFDLKHLEEIRSGTFRRIPGEWRDRVLRHRHTMNICTALTVATTPLAEEAKLYFPHGPICVLENAASVEMQRSSRSALRKQGDGALRIVYVSGSDSHDVDILEIADALEHTLHNHPDACLRIIGPLRLPRQWERFGDRIEHIDFVPATDLPRWIAGSTLNIAPLQTANHFAECKSAIKYLEAALCGVPTVASSVPSFREAIEHGKNGFLCETSEDWEGVLELLLRFPKEAKRSGAAALEDAMQRHTTKARVRMLLPILEAIGATVPV